MSSAIPTSRASLLAYKGIGYGAINELLREESIPIDRSKMTEEMLRHPEIQHVINIDSMMGNNHSLRGTPFFRGVHGLDMFIKEQGTLINKAYSSCSTDIEEALKFTGDECCIVTFLIPDEVKFYNYQTLGINDTEREVLIQRNTQLDHFRLSLAHKGRRVYSCVLKLYAVPIISDSDKKKQFVLEQMLAEARAKSIASVDDDEEFERMLAEDN